MNRILATTLAAAGELVADGGLVVYPTDTLYGVGGDATRRSVAKRVLALKGLSTPRPFPILVPSLAPAREAATVEVRPALDALARLHWPGALTVIVPLNVDARRRLAPAAPDGTAGFRMPAHPTARYLSARAGGYLIGTSANLTGDAPPGEPGALDSDLVANVDGWLEAGPPCGGRASTVLDLTGKVPVVLRVGDLGAGTLLAHLEGLSP